MRRSILCLRVRSVAATRAAPVPEVQRRGQGLLRLHPAEQQEAIRQAHQAWLRFNEIANEIAASNRQRLLKALDCHKQVAKAARAKARAKA